MTEGDVERRDAAPTRDGRRGLHAWLVTTVLLAAACAALWWHVQGRVPATVERVVPAPPSALAPEQMARAARLNGLAASLEDRLAALLAELEAPPVCRPGERLDHVFFEDLLRRESEGLTRWRGVALAPDPTSTALPVPADELPQPEPNDAALEPSTASPADADDLAHEAAIRPVGELRALLEGSAAMVFSPTTDGGLSTGTAFFVSPELLVTNRHVVEGADPTRLIVASKRLGTASRVELVASSPPGDAAAPDFALLRLRAGTAPAVAPVAAGGEKLTPVVAAGYPGLGLVSDAGFRRLLDGDLTSAPDLNMNRGEIRSVQLLGGITRLIHTADVLKGYSGGPLLDGCGRVIGVNTFIQVDQAQGGKLNNATSTGDLLAFLAAHRVRLPLDTRDCNSG
jgi:S1-C subfamily serine protease